MTRARSDSLTNIASLLEEYMEANDLTQEQLAKQLGATQGTVSKWLTGYGKIGLKYYLAIEKLKLKRKP
jgi:transcriptional regulator with XRE-family HTH domain